MKQFTPCTMISHVCSHIHYNSYGLENRANIMNLQHPKNENRGGLHIFV